MLRPSRPMMRPLRSSLGRSTTDTVVSMACSAALRWMASAMICCARTAAVSRASVSRRLTRLAASRRASPSICFSSRSRASSAVRPGHALQFAMPFGDELVGVVRGGRGGRFVLGDGLSPRAQILLDAVAGGEPIGQARGFCRPAPARGSGSRRAAGVPASPPRRLPRGPSRALRARPPCGGSPRRARPDGRGVRPLPARGQCVSTAIRRRLAAHQTRAPRVARKKTGARRRTLNVTDEPAGRPMRVTVLYVKPARRVSAGGAGSPSRGRSKRNGPRFAVWGGRMNLL